MINDEQYWMYLMEGDEGRSIWPLIDVATHLKTLPGSVMRIAADMKRESGKNPVAEWIQGVPWFNVATIKEIEGRLVLERATAVAAAAASTPEARANLQ